MHMTFWWDVKIENFLFYGYNISSKGLLALTCLALVALGIIFEWLRLLQAKQRRKELLARANQIRTICPPTESATLLTDRQRNANSSKPNRCTRVGFVLCDFCLWLNMQILSYMLMLVVMLYNGWLVISLILGSTIGYFVFGPKFIKINFQNCETMRDTFCYVNCVESETPSGTSPPAEPSTSPSTSVVSTQANVTACIHSEPI